MIVMVDDHGYVLSLPVWVITYQLIISTNVGGIITYPLRISITSMNKMHCGTWLKQS